MIATLRRYFGPWPRRNDLSELMDEPGVSREELRQALVFLGKLNRWSFSRRWIASHVLPGRVLDVATGGGDIPEYLVRCGRARVAVGIDQSAVAVGLARELSPSVILVRADGGRLPFADGAFDSAIAHLLFHHLKEEECGQLLREMARVARRVVVVDLERSRVLCWVVWCLMWLGGNRISRHDGPVSVRRAWTREEMQRIATRALPKAMLVEVGPYRWGVLVDGFRPQAD